MSIIKGKVIMLGDGAVGKTSLIRRFVLDQFSDEYVTTIGAKITKKEVIISMAGTQTAKVTMMLWDIPGQWEHTRDRFFSFKKYKPQSQFFLGARGALVLCDLTKRDSLENVTLWAETLQKEAGKVPMVIIGNKSDLANHYQFTPDELQEVAAKFGAPCFLTSAKSGLNVNMSFGKLAELLYNATTQNAGAP